MNPRVTTVKPTAHYQLVLVFDDGSRRIYDCSHLLDFGVFGELRDIGYFRRALVANGTVAWPHEQDLCPDTLYLDASPCAASPDV